MGTKVLFGYYLSYYLLISERLSLKKKFYSHWKQLSRFHIKYLRVTGILPVSLFNAFRTNESRFLFIPIKSYVAWVVRQKMYIKIFIQYTNYIWPSQLCFFSISYSNILTNNDELFLIALDNYYQKSMVKVIWNVIIKNEWKCSHINIFSYLKRLIFWPSQLLLLKLS